MLLGPKNFRPGQRDDNARLQKLERTVQQLMARIDALEARRGPGRPRKDEQAAA